MTWLKYNQAERVIFVKNSERPIIVFDSGLGGISVLRKLIQVMPREKFMYFGDSANAPYGPRDPQEVCQLTVDGMAQFDALQPKALVIACNTATAAAQEALEKRYPQIPVVGIEPAVRQALQENPGGRILSLATAGTLASSRYQKQLKEVEGQGEVVSVAAPGIVKYVEGGMSDHEGIVAYLRELTAPWQTAPFQGVVLGCTHFPFAWAEVQEALGYPVRFYEPSSRIAQETRDRIVAQKTANGDTDCGSVTIQNSTNADEMLSLSWKLLTNC